MLDNGRRADWEASHHTRVQLSNAIRNCPLCAMKNCPHFGFMIGVGYGLRR
jgi:hypothetical protein